MVIGYLLQKKIIFGSCGGFGVLGIDKVCDCFEFCDCKKVWQEREVQCQEKLKVWEKDCII